MARGTAARAAAIEILKGTRSGKPFEISQDEAVAGLSDKDRRLAHEIAAGVLRHQTELDALIKPLLTDGWGKTAAELRDLLRVGVYQLTYLSRIPEYAAVQATVEVTKNSRGVRGARLVNAVLRRVAGAHRIRTDTAGVSTPSDLADAESHPHWLVARWADRFGVERTGELLRHNNRRPPLVIQPVGWSIDRLRDALSDKGIPVSETHTGAGLVVQDARVEELPGYEEGAFIVQDAAQAMLLRFAEVQPDAVVWDACAAPGGKAAVLSKRGPVVASDFNRSRIPRLRDTLSRAAPGISVLVADASKPPIKCGSVDVVLVDAPCTGTGSLARHPEGRWRLSERSIQQMAERQATILGGASTAVGVGGVLVYLTCSLEPEENHKQIDCFLESRPAFRRDCDDLFLFPPETGTDGGFGARMRRVI